MRLYEFGPTRSIRARWVLQELGVPFEAVNVDLRRGEHRAQEFLALNPAGKIPVLIDDDRAITESVAIVLYLAEKHPQARLLPEDLHGRAQAYRWLLFAATELEQPLWRIAKHTALYPQEGRIPADVVLASEEFRSMARVVEDHLARREYLVGDSVCVADFVMAYTLDWADEAKLLEGFPEARRYMLRMYARPHAPKRIAEAFERIAAGPT